MSAERAAGRIDRLLVVTGFWPTRKNPISGIFVVQQVAALLRAGVRVVLVVPTNALRPDRRICTATSLGLDERLLGFLETRSFQVPEQFLRMPGIPWLNARNCGTALERTIRAAEKSGSFDGAIVHGLRYGGFSVPAWRHLVQGRVAVVVHGFDPFLSVPRNAERLRPMLEATAVSANHVVLVGSALRSHARALGLPEERLRVVANGTDVPPRHAISFAQRSRTDARRIVSVGNLVHWKGTDDNLRALAVLASRRPELSWRYRIVGDGPCREELISLSSRLGLGERVTFLGRLSYNETMREIADADLFSLPSWGEAFGIVYLEALARARPAIGCLRNGAADILTHGHDGFLVPPRDIEALAGALARLIEDPALAMRLGTAGRDTSERFSWDENCRRMIGLLEASDAYPAGTVRPET